MQSPGIIIAFFAGIASVASPCILPILPSFMAYLTGVSLSKDYEQKNLRLKLFIDTVLFALGFSIIFLLFGAVIGFIGENLILNRALFQKIAGIIIIIFGLQLSGILKIKTLLQERKIILPERFKKFPHLRSFLIGLFFAFSWAPCYGPIIGSIFTLAATQANFNQAMILFIFYSLGFLTPLLIISLFIGASTKFIKKYKNLSRYCEIVSAILIIILGILLLTDKMNLLVNLIAINYN